MDTLSLIKEIKNYHDYYNRWITFGSGLAVSFVFLGLWWGRVELLDQYRSFAGLVLILLAVIFYKLPYLSYLLNKKRYRNHPEGLAIIGKSWKEYCTRVMMRY